MTTIKQTLTTYLLLLSIVVFSQNVDVSKPLTGKPFKVNGTLAANSVFFNSSQPGGRAPFTYFLQGVLNFSVYQFSMPVTYSYSNQGDNLDYQTPYYL